MFWLGLAVTIAYIPGITGASIPTGWAVLSCSLPLTQWRMPKLGPIHWVLFAFFGYACLSLTWAADFLIGIWGLWLLAIWIGAFCLGASERLIVGIAYGLYVSVLIACFQAIGWSPVVTWIADATPGLFYNQMIFGEACALTILALGACRLWPMALPLLPGIYFAHSRGAVLALVIGLLAQFRRPMLLVLSIALLAAIITGYPGGSDSERLFIWKSAWGALSTFGHGPTSFLLMWFKHDSIITHPEYVHNDFLDFTFQYGLGAISLFAVLILCATRVQSPWWPTFIAFLTMACFSFPFYSPVTAFIGAVVAGSLGHDWNRNGSFGFNRRYGSLLWNNHKAARMGNSRSKAVPV